MPYDETESVATHNSRLQPLIIHMLQLQPWCSAALVPKFTTLKSGMKALRSDQPWSNYLVHYLSLEPHFTGERQVLPLDHQRFVPTMSQSDSTHK